MIGKNKHICPVKRAGALDNRVRRFFQNPRKILGPHIEDGMTVLDLGCGSGFFSVEMARMVGASGRVIAVDLQEGMLEKLRGKIQGTDIEKRIELHKCEQDKTGVLDKVDLVFAFYVVHEVPDPKRVLEEIKFLLRPGGKLFIAEPKLFHVSKRAFEETVRKAEEIGFEAVGKPKVLFSRAIVMKI